MREGKVNSMKHTLLLILAAFVILLGCTACAEASPASDFEYTNCGTYISITKYTGTAQRVVVPETIDGLPVEEVVLSGSISAVNPYVRTVVLPSTVRKLGLYAFARMDYLHTIEGLEYVQHIGQYAFRNTAVTEMSFSTALDYLEYDAFGQSNIIHLTIPDDVTWSATSTPPFGNMHSLQTVTLLDGTDEATIALLDGCIVSADGKDFILYPFGRMGTSFTIPAQIKTIQRSSFSLGRSGGYLSELSIPSTVEKIDYNAISSLGIYRLFVAPDSPGLAYAQQTSAWDSQCTYIIVESGDSSQSIEARVKEIVAACITPGMTDLEKARAMIDWCAENVTYSYDHKSAYDIFFEGKGLCAAYADAYKMLMDEIGIPCYVVGNYNHAFNAIRIGGQWIYADPTNCFGSDASTRYLRFAFEDTLFDYFYGGVDLENSASISSSTARYHYFYNEGYLDDAILYAQAQIQSGLNSGCTNFSFAADTSLLYYSYDVSGRLVAAIITENGWEINGETVDITCTYSSSMFYFTIGDMPEETVSEFEYDIVNGMARITAYTGTDTEVTIPAALDGYTVGYIGTAFTGNLDVTKITLPDTLVGINANAFKECISLTQINFPATLTTIGAYAFEKCYVLSVPITLPEGLTALGEAAFQDCGSITTASLPDSLGVIPDMLFLDCVNLRSVTLGDSVQMVNGAAFSGCKVLSSITLPDTVWYIGNGVFNGTALTALHIPASVTLIGAQLVRNCDALTSLTVAPGNTYYTVIGNVLYSLEDGKPAILKCAPVSAPITELVIPDTVYRIDDSALYGNKTLRRLHISSGVRTINDNAFAYCNALETITMDEGVETISSGAFSVCSSLTSIQMADSITTLANSAFNTCAHVAQINIPRSITEAYWIPACALTHIYVHENVTLLDISCYAWDATIYIHGVPGTYAETFAAENGYSFVCWHEETEVPMIPATHLTTGLTAGTVCVNCGEPVSVREEIPVKVLTVSVLPADLTAIEAGALTGTDMACIEIPDGCLSIGDRAFAGSPMLQVIVIPASVTDFGADCFVGCHDEFVILTTDGSAAQQYAEANGIPCVAR